MNQYPYTNEHRCNQLDPKLSNVPWTREEDERLVAAHEAHGNAWAKIAEVLLGRSDNMIKVSSSEKLVTSPSWPYLRQLSCILDSAMRTACLNCPSLPYLLSGTLKTTSFQRF